MRYFVGPHDSAVPSGGGGGFRSIGEGVAVDAAGNVYGGEVGAVTGVTKSIPRLVRR